MRISTLGLAAFLALSSSLPALAATTADDAAKLQASLQAYFGKGADALKITPDGDGFKVVLDVTPMLAAAKQAGEEISLSPIEMNLTPEGNGKWKIKHDGPLKLSIKGKDQMQVDEVFENFSMDGEFDEALGYFSALDMQGKNITVSENMTDPAGATIKADGKIESVSAKATGVANAAGGVDAKVTETFGPGTMSENITSDKEPPFPMQFSMAGASLDATYTGLKTLAMLDLLKFMVAHPDKATIAKDQPALKTALAALLPVWSNINAQATINKLEAQTPMGRIAAEKVGIGLDLNGAVKDGKFGETVSAEGLTLPAELVPPWAAKLVPKNASVGFSVSGYDAETPVKAALDGADFSKEEPIAQELQDKLFAMLLPKGTVDVALTKTAVNNDVYELTAEGSFQAGPAALPTGKAHITAKGLDDLMQIMQAAPPEAGLQGGAAVIVVAKGLAKPDADGKLFWDVQATPDGKVLVNGVDAKNMAK